MDWDTRLIWLYCMALTGGVCSIVALLFVYGEVLEIYVFPAMYGANSVLTAIITWALRQRANETVAPIFGKIALVAAASLPIAMFLPFAAADASTRGMALLVGSGLGSLLGLLVVGMRSVRVFSGPLD